MFKLVLVVFLNLFSLAVLGLPASSNSDNLPLKTGFGSPGAMLTLHAAADCTGPTMGSFYLLKLHPVWNNTIGAALSISVGSSTDGTQVSFFDQLNAEGNCLGTTNGNNQCATFGADIWSAQLAN